MKRIVTLLLAAGLVMGAYTGAQAADVKVSGKWNFGFHFMDSVDHGKTDGAEDDFTAVQRLRLQMDIIASENLKGVIFFEIGGSTWGVENEADLGADDKTVKVKRSYIDWTVPNTDAMVRMGIQGLTLPGTFGSALFDDDVAALTVSNAFNDNFALTAFWARPYDANIVDEKVNHDGNDEMDMFGLVAPITLDGHAITPYFVYASVGENSAIPTNPNLSAATVAALNIDENVDAYYFGVAYSMTAFDPFTFDASFLYGSAEGGDIDQSGWMVDFKAAYALDFMTPALIGWYATGDDKDDQGILPTFGAGCWYPTSFGYAGSCFWEDSHMGDTPAGTWALGLELADISFVEDLSHVFRVVYMQGTSEQMPKNAVYRTSPLVGDCNYVLGEEDSAVEVNLDSTYQIYENLAFILELGYIDIDKENGTLEDAAYKATFNFVYSF